MLPGMPDTRDRGRARLVGWTGLVLAFFVIMFIVSSLGGDPRILLHFGTDYPDPRVLEYGYRHLGADLPVLELRGHDGKWTFVMAMDPLLLDPAEHASIMDYPAYRAQRVLLPLLVAPVGLFAGPPSLAWAITLANTLAMGFGVWGTARLAERLGASPWWGLLFLVNLGVWLEVAISGTGVLGLALAVWGMNLALEDRFRLAGWVFAAAALTRESMLPAALGVGLWLLWRRGWSPAWRVVGPPLAALGLWSTYVWWRLGEFPAGGGETTLALPLVGPLQAAGRWSEFGAASTVIGSTMVVVCLVALWQAVRTRHLVAFAGAGVAVLALSISAPSWWFWYDPPRVVSLLLITVPLLIVTRRRQDAGSIRNSWEPMISEATASSERSIAGAVLVITVALLVSQGLGSLDVGGRELIDTDGYMRTVRAVELADGSSGWFDGSARRSDAPFGHEMHWTRPMDVLLVVAGLPWLIAGTGAQDALYWASVIVGPLLLVAIALAVTWAAVPLTGRRWAPLAGAIAIAQPALTAYTAPGRSDHHALILLAAGVAAGGALRLLAGTGRRAGAVTGVALGLGLWVSVESLFVVGVIGLVLGAAWVAWDGWIPGG
jgi:hypothetical protein